MNREQMARFVSDIKATDWAKKIKGDALAKLWIIAAMTGGFLISMMNGRTHTDTGIFVFLRLSLPVLILLVYAGYGYRYANRQEFPLLRAARVGQLADSLYFLGFLWTLWALIDSFVIHEMSVAEAVFRAFGYALVTTATGMFLRLLMLQFMYGEDQIAAADQNIEEQIAKFNRQLSTTITTVALVASGTEAALKKSSASIAAACEGLEAKLKEINAQSIDIQKGLETVFENVATGIATKIDPSLNDIVRANNDVAVRIAGIAQQIDAVRIGPDLLESVVERVVERKVGSGLGTFQVTLERAAAAVAATCAGMEARLKEINSQSIDIRKSLETVFAKAATQITAHIEPSLDNIVRANDDVARRIAGVAKQIEMVRIPLDLVERTVDRKVDPVIATLQSTSAALNSTVTSFNKTVALASSSLSPRRRRWWFSSARR